MLFIIQYCTQIFPVKFSTHQYHGRRSSFQDYVGNPCGCQSYQVAANISKKWEDKCSLGSHLRGQYMDVSKEQATLKDTFKGNLMSIYYVCKGPVTTICVSHPSCVNGKGEQCWLLQSPEHQIALLKVSGSRPRSTIPVG